MIEPPDINSGQISCSRHRNSRKTKLPKTEEVLLAFHYEQGAIFTIVNIIDIKNLQTIGDK